MDMCNHDETKFIVFYQSSIISSVNRGSCSITPYVFYCYMKTMCICVQMCVRYLGTSKPMVCFLPETVMRATLGTTSESSLL